MSIRAALLSAILVAASATAALADDAPTTPAVSKGALIGRARAAEARGDHATAASALEAAYAASCDPRLLREVGQELEANGDGRRAMAYYSRFLAEAKDAPAEVRRETARRIGALGASGAGQSPLGEPTVGCGVATAASVPPPPADSTAPQPIVAAGAVETPAIEVDATPPATPAPLTVAGAPTLSLELQLVPGANWHGSFQLGRRFGDVTLGVGLDVAQSSDSADDGTDSASRSATAVMVTPGARIPLVRSADQRVEGFAALDVGVGTVFAEEPAGMDVSTLLVSWRIGPGVRYWLHRQLAVGGTVGVGAAHVIQTITESASGMSVDHIHSDMATSGALQLVALF